jgi:hypothetical protein
MRPEYEQHRVKRAVAALFDAREYLEELDQTAAVDAIDEVRNALIDRLEGFDAQIAIHCRDVLGRCTTTIANTTTCADLSEVDESTRNALEYVKDSLLDGLANYEHLFDERDDAHAAISAAIEAIKAKAEATGPAAPRAAESDVELVTDEIFGPSSSEGAAA